MTHPKDDPEAINALKAQVADLQKALANKADSAAVSKLEQNVGSVSQALDGKADKGSHAGLDEQQVSALIDKEVSQAKAALEKSIASQKSSTPPTVQGIDKAQVSTMIKDAMASAAQANNTQQPAIDFSSEIETIKQDKAEIAQYLNDIKQQGEHIQASLKESLNQVEQKIQAANDRPMVAPLLNSLNLAEVASKSHQYGVAADYLAQAASVFDSLNLNQAPYAQFAEQISALQKQTQTLAAQQQDHNQLDAVIKSVSDWPFASTDVKNLLSTEPDDKPTESWKDDLKNIGSNILAKTVTITKNDTAGLTWVNENPSLQQIIRENVRLDLAMIRNALLIGDEQRVQTLTATLRTEIQRYFDTSAPGVEKALNVLEQTSVTPSDAPDIASLIQSIKQAG